MKFSNSKSLTAGFTTLELLIALAVSGIAIFLLIGFQTDMFKEQFKLGKKIEGVTDTEIGKRVILQDLKAIDPSFANMLLVDDAGKKFFDYYPDLSVERLGPNATRKITIDFVGKRRSLEFFTLDNSTGDVPVILYDPYSAYDEGPGSDHNVPRKLSFVSLNRGNYITSELNRPRFWRNGQVIMLDTPASIRATSTSVVDMLKVPRSPIFVGIVQGSNLTLPPLFRTLLDYSDPQDPIGSKMINSADQFLRSAPAVGGGQPTIRLKSLKLTKYTLEPYSKKTKGKQLGRLVKQVYKDGRYSNTKFGLADNVVKVEFERQSVTEKSIYFKILTEY